MEERTQRLESGVMVSPTKIKADMMSTVLRLILLVRNFPNFFFFKSFGYERKKFQHVTIFKKLFLFCLLPVVNSRWSIQKIQI